MPIAQLYLHRRNLHEGCARRPCLHRTYRAKICIGKCPRRRSAVPENQVHATAKSIAYLANPRRIRFTGISTGTRQGKPIRSNRTNRRRRLLQGLPIARELTLDAENSRGDSLESESVDRDSESRYLNGAQLRRDPGETAACIGFFEIPCDRPRYRGGKTHAAPATDERASSRDRALHTVKGKMHYFPSHASGIFF